MPIWDHLEELRERVLVAALAAAVAIGGCFCFSKELVLFLEAPVADAGVRFLQLSPGEFFFTTFKVCCSAWLAENVRAAILRLHFHDFQIIHCTYESVKQCLTLLVVSAACTTAYYINRFAPAPAANVAISRGCRNQATCISMPAYDS